MAKQEAEPNPAKLRLLSIIALALTSCQANPPIDRQTLPQYDEPKTTIGQIVQDGIEIGSGLAALETLRQNNIHLVACLDDEPRECAEAKTAIEAAIPNTQVHAFKNCETFLPTERPYEVAIIDGHMGPSKSTAKMLEISAPMDGADCVQALRTTDTTIYLIAHSGGSINQDMFRYGANIVVAKGPVAELVAAVKIGLNQSAK